MNSRSFPPRSDSITPSHSQPKLPGVADEIRDARRVQTHGQEEDLRDALGQMIGRMEELSTLLAQAYRSQTEMETSLKLARSNLQLALANNEMLEDALKRDGFGKGKDVGWRRWSEREGERRGRILEVQNAEREREHRPSLESAPSTPNMSSAVSNASAATNGNGTASMPGSPSTGPSAVVGAASPTPSQDGRFFRFRFGSASAAPSRAHSPPAPASLTAAAKRVEAERDAAHLTSASLPSLVVAPSKREEDLNVQLEAERVKHRMVSDEKKALEAEIESLSQALFEEANKMVAQERIKRAETEEELRQEREEKEALKGALRVVEMENGRLRCVEEITAGRDSPSSMRAQRRMSINSTGHTSSTPASPRDSLRSSSPPASSDAPAVSAPIPSNPADDPPPPSSPSPPEVRPSLNTTSSTSSSASDSDSAFKTPRALPSDIVLEEAPW